MNQAALKINRYITTTQFESLLKQSSSRTMHYSLTEYMVTLNKMGLNVAGTPTTNINTVNTRVESTKWIETGQTESSR
jgi:hypothetical protein